MHQYRLSTDDCLQPVSWQIQMNVAGRHRTLEQAEKTVSLKAFRFYSQNIKLIFNLTTAAEINNWLIDKSFKKL